MRVLQVLSVALSAACAATAQPLPAELEAALSRTRVPRDAITLLVADVDASRAPRLRHRVDVPVNPASIAKLATTMAALEQLGPAFTWSTPVYADAPVVDGTLQGNLYLKGQGDPKLVTEQLWVLMRRVRGLGIQAIAGDIVLDRSAFDLPAMDPAAFDGQPQRPYNAVPDALLVNYKSVMLSFSPHAGQAWLQVEPPLAGVQWPASVPLAAGACGDWLATLKPDFSDPTRVRFLGAFPAACAHRSWPLAWHTEPRAHAARAVAGMWLETGGRLSGQVREGSVPAGLAPLFEHASPALAEVVREVNKFSNNVMAQQLFLTLSLQRTGRGSVEASRELMRQWWLERMGGQAPWFDNGSGLSRMERISAAQLARLLQYTWASPLMPEMVASLPRVGMDGTLRRASPAAPAHLKSGSLQDVWGVAGYVHGASGRRYVLVAIANHANAGTLRGAFLEAVLTWAARDT